MNQKPINNKKYLFSGKKTVKNTFATILIVVSLIIIAVVIRINFIKESPYIDNKDQAITKCIDLCQNTRKFEGIDPQGPCLSEEIVLGWGCDVVHNPKLPLVDDDKINRCVNSRHVVEVSFVCDLVSAK
jgi:hypothetical protein